MPTTGFKFPAAQTMGVTAAVNWTAPENILASDNARATVVLTVGQSAEWIYLRQFSFGIQANARVTGFEVAYEGYSLVELVSVDFQFHQSDVLIGTLGPLANLDLFTGPPDTSSATVNQPIGAVNDPTNQFGLNSLTIADFNATTFGLAVRVEASGVGDTANMDAVSLKLNYDLLGGGGVAIAAALQMKRK